MQVFVRQSFSDDNEVGVHIDVRLENRKLPTFYAYIRVEGDAELRAIWRNEFNKWAEDFGLKAEPRRGKKRTTATTEFDVAATDWKSINAFMLRWVGVDWIVKTLQEKREMDLDMFAEIRQLRWQIRRLSQNLKIGDFRMKGPA